jgi:putative ABC transport system permease protein
VNWLETLRVGWQAVRAHRLRSVLTVLGILIGIATVVLSVGLGEGASSSVKGQIAALGSNLLIVTPGSSTSSTGVRGGLGSASSLTVSDADALGSRTAAPDIRAVAASKTTSEELTFGSTNWTTSVVGTTSSWLSVRSRQIASGRFLTDADEEQAAAVTVLGPETASELFGALDPVGQTVTINDIPFTVIGVLTSAGSDSSSNLDDTAVIPMTTEATRLAGNSGRESISNVYVAATSAHTISAAYQEADSILLYRHGLTTTGADFTITTQDSLLTTAKSVSKTLTVLLGGIAALSLLVGGIGVMNIMLVSVTERTREIGLRKALGATPSVIRRQFLVEASVLGTLGGIAGAGLGIVGAVVLPHFISNDIAISPSAVVGAIVVAVAIGLIFGVYPASRAARLAPIDALRSQ